MASPIRTRIFLLSLTPAHCAGVMARSLASHSQKDRQPVAQQLGVGRSRKVDSAHTNPWPKVGDQEGLFAYLFLLLSWAGWFWQELG